jgi:hypothetical protein
MNYIEVLVRGRLTTNTGYTDHYFHVVAHQIEWLGGKPVRGPREKYVINIIIALTMKRPYHGRPIP